MWDAPKKARGDPALAGATMREMWGMRAGRGVVCAVAKCSPLLECWMWGRSAQAEEQRDRCQTDGSLSWGTLPGRDSPTQHP